jgi:uncharacterized protein with HEPN domain
MPRDYRVYLEDILEAARKIHRYTSAMSAKEFASDPRTFDAVVRNLEIIGEAAKKFQKPSARKGRKSNGNALPGCATS